MKKLIIGNWKTNPDSGEEAKSIARAIKRGAGKAKSDIVICPPFIYLGAVKNILGKGKIMIGAQDVSGEINGAHTGEVSADMIRDAGARFAVIGHSERRAMGETDETINKKVKSALKSRLIAVLCVGERERDSHGYYLAAVKKQIEHAFAGIPGTLLPNIVVAYEPVWAVGNKNFHTATPHDAVEMALFIKKTLADKYGAKRASSLRVLYGGSVNSKNAGEFLAENGIAGLLVGRESLSPKQFLAIASV